MAAVLLTRGKLKAFTHETGFGENAVAQVPLLENREMAEAIIERVPHIHMPVYEWVTPPLTDHPERVLEDWERDMEDYHMRPMPSYVPHLPARVTAFTSHPWGRVGVFLVVFDDPEPAQLDRAWIEELANSANSSGGIMLVTEQVGSAQALES